MQQKNTTKMIRNGPRPLWLHLNAGATMMSMLTNDDAEFHAASGILQQAMNGVQAYHHHPAQPCYRDMKIIAQKNGTRAIALPSWQGRESVILIPSLINSWHIFDIDEYFSIAASLYDQGLTPIIIDWAEPIDQNISLNDYITHHLRPLIISLRQQGYNIKGLLGYCMGGTMIAALLSAYPDLIPDIQKVVLIAPPWDFSYQSVEQAMRLHFMAMQTYALSSPVPNDFVQSLFWAIDPLQVLKKFRTFPNVSNPERFVRVEDWLNEGRAVSLSVIQTCLFDWYRDNAIMKGQWIINNNPVTANGLTCPTLIATGTKDNLVPIESSQPLIQSNPHARHIHVDTGHIGLMASDKSVAALWKPIAEFLK